MESDDRLWAALERAKMANKAGKLTVTREVTGAEKADKAAETRRLRSYMDRMHKKRIQRSREAGL